jgi:hypothetical protein
MWVRSEYANELAVLSAWLAMFVPWSGATHTEVHSSGLEGDIIFIRFPFFELQFRTPALVEVQGTTRELGMLEDTYPGTELFGDTFATTPPSSVLFYDATLWQASLLWLVAAVGFALALLLSLALYFREEWVGATLPVSPVRLMGGLLGVGALGTAGASYFHYLARDTVGFPIPAGVLVVAVLAAVLLRTESVERANHDESPGGPADPEA